MFVKSDENYGYTKERKWQIYNLFSPLLKCSKLMMNDMSVHIFIFLFTNNLFSHNNKTRDLLVRI